MARFHLPSPFRHVAVFGHGGRRPASLVSHRPNPETARNEPNVMHLAWSWCDWSIADDTDTKLLTHSRPKMLFSVSNRPVNRPG